MNDHTLKSYDTELDELRSIVARMGGLAESQLTGAVRALKELDCDAAKSIIKSDETLDQLERQAERASMVLFARRAPVADDLREVVSVLKMTTLVERMGDYAKNIARRALAIAAEDPIDLPDLIEPMADEAAHMIQGAMDSYVRRDQSLAVKVWEHDETLDNLHNSANRDILTDMIERPEHIGSLTHMLMIAKNLERVGDQATNVSEQVYYALTGATLDSCRPKNDVTAEENFAALNGQGQVSSK